MSNPSDKKHYSLNMCVVCMKKRTIEVFTSSKKENNLCGLDFCYQDEFTQIEIAKQLKRIADAMEGNNEKL